MPTSPLESASSEPQKKGLFGRPILLGCLGFLAILALAIGVGTYWLFTSGKTVISNEIRKEVVKQVEAAKLPIDQQSTLRAEIDRLTEGFQNGEISIKELVLIAEAIDQSPVGSIMRYYGADGNPIDLATISDEEKEAAMITIRRFVYGVFQDKIPESALDDLVNPFITDRGNGDYDDIRFRTDITDEELLAALAKAKQMADDAEIETDDLRPDLAAEVKEIVDRILNGRE